METDVFPFLLPQRMESDSSAGASRKELLEEMGQT